MYQNELICLNQLFFGTTEQSNKVDVKMTKEAKIYWVELEIQERRRGWAEEPEAGGCN